MDSPGYSTNPTVSIIVPVRNEEACLAHCIESLVSQSGVSFEIIVVDDGSTDRSREIAESFRGVRVISVGALRGGWIGKNNAVFTGANESLGSWLLFTDADTFHYAGSLARALGEARQHGASLLSYSPEQEVHTFWEKALIPVIFAELAAAYRPTEVNDPTSPAAAANGQYMLIARDAYEAVGGHVAVARSLLEDVDLARLVKKSGRKIYFRYGAGRVRTRMYRNFAKLREGWTKNLALLFPSALKLAALRSTEFVIILGCTIVALILAMRGSLLSAAMVAGIGLVFYSRFLIRISKAHFAWDANAIALFGLPFFSYLLVRSWIQHRKGRVNWKGRIYRRSSNASSNDVGLGVPTGSADRRPANVYHYQVKALD